MDVTIFYNRLVTVQYLWGWQKLVDCTLSMRNERNQSDSVQRLNATRSQFSCGSFIRTDASSEWQKVLYSIHSTEDENY